MRKKQFLISAAVVLALAALVYLQIRTWRRFDWGVFWQQTSQARLLPIVWAVAFIYVADVLRGVRWKIFLRPVCQAKVWNLVPPQFIGFTAMALLGRPGEFVRPYLIARRENLTLSSQVAVWTVERIFDIGAFTIWVTVAIFSARSLRHLPYFQEFRQAGLVLIVLVAGMVATAIFMRRKSAVVANWLEKRLSRVAPRVARHVCHKARAFGQGLNTIHDAASFFQLAAISLLMWLFVALAYRAVTHAFPAPLHHMTTANVVVLLAFTMVGSTVQLPAIGGGAQLMSIAALVHVFNVPSELAVSCGILLWLVTFMAVIPVGLALAHREHVSLRAISKESHLEEEAEETGERAVVQPPPAFSRPPSGTNRLAS
jgi:uncharacterized protein (TIRG00374 family)